MSLQRLVAIVIVLASRRSLSRNAHRHSARHMAARMLGVVDAGADVEEILDAAKGGSMIGVSRTIRDGKTTAYEMIVLREQGDQLAYVAHPSGQAPATFLSTRVARQNWCSRIRRTTFRNRLAIGSTAIAVCVDPWRTERKRPADRIPVQADAVR